jgi:hypothetical protein
VSERRSEEGLGWTGLDGMPSAYEGLVERLREHLHESQGPGLGLGLPEASTGAAACR